MKIEEYTDIVQDIRRYQGFTKDCAKLLIAKYSSYHPQTLYSILSKEIQLKMKVTHTKMFGKHRKYYKTYLEAVARKESIGYLLRLALYLDTCPALLARKVLEEYLEDQYHSKHKQLNKLLRDTSLIKDRNLALEIYLCILHDDQYGPISNTLSYCHGVEYEVKLEHCLIERSIPFSNEDQLRLKGYDKTPDCKLEVPIAVNGFVINWIESKAQFGNVDSHKKYINEQFLSYWNRFGPGLVIYWFGFIDNIIQTSERRFIIMDHFPENITYMDPTSLMKSLK